MINRIVEINRAFIYLFKNFGSISYEFINKFAPENRW